MKELLCEAFCSRIAIRKVPVGYAVTTPYLNIDGDPILFYLVQEGTDEGWHLEDDGTQIPFLEAAGVNLKGTRAVALQALCDEFRVNFDAITQTIFSRSLGKNEIGIEAISFIGFLLRLQDLALLDNVTVKNTFREDALAAIHSNFDSIALVQEAAYLSNDMPSISADIVISADGIAPLAVYLGTSEEKGLQALVLKMEAESYRAISNKVILLVENAKKNPLRESTYALAQARLDSVLSFRGTERDAMSRLKKLFSSGPAIPYGVH